MEEQPRRDTETQQHGDTEPLEHAGANAPVSPLPAGEGQGEGQPAGEGEDSALSTADSALSVTAELEQLRTELQEARIRQMESHRRALLAENAGRIVPELVVGATAQELDQSVEGARRAFEAAKAAALAELSSQPVPAGNPVRQGPNLEGMSPMEKIAYGLKRD